MQIIPLSAVASQTLAVALGGQSVQLNIYQLGDKLFIDVISNGVSMVTARQCRSYSGLAATAPRWIMDGRHYLGFLGDLLFIDTQPNPVLDPQASGLGARWILAYFSTADLEGAGLVG